ncbi:MAG: helix-turn-helix transcriptional regulator [Candidatus Omnitrophota bacterium]
MIKHIERAKDKMRLDITANVSEIISPILARMRKRKTHDKYIDLLEGYLKELTSSFGCKITHKSNKLTPREIEICNMLRGGLTTKELSGLLNISIQTVERHRKSIRKKLGISHKAVNLTSHLQNL